MTKNAFSPHQWLDYIKQLKRLADSKYGGFSRFCQFCLVGGTGMVVDLLMYNLLIAAGIPLGSSRAAAIWVAMTWNFWLNRRITFSYSREHPLSEQYLKFLLSCSLGAVLSWSVSVGLAKGNSFFQCHFNLAAIIGIVLGTACNYLLSAFWVFQHKLATSPDIASERPQTNFLARRSIIIVGIIALATRLLYMGWTWTDWYVLPEDPMVALYFDEGYALCAGYGYIRSYTEDGWRKLDAFRKRVATEDLQTLREKRDLDTTDIHPEFIHPPGWPLLIAGFRAFLDVKAEVPMQLLGAMFDTLAACLLVYVTGKFFSRRVAFLAGVFYALYPPLAYAAVNKYPDGTLSVFILGCLICAIEGIQADNKKRHAWWIAAGMVLGLGCYLRPDYLFVPVAIAVGLWMYSGRFLRAFSALLLMLSVSLLVLLPWAFRNYQLCGRWLFTSSSVGGTMVTGLGEYNNPWGFGRTDLDREQQAKDQGLGSAWSPEADIYFRNLFWEAVKQHPLAYAQAVVKRIPIAISPPNAFGYASPYRKRLYFTTEMKKGLSFPQVILANPKYIIAAYWDVLFMALLGLLIFLCSLYMIVREWRTFPLIFLLLSPHLYSIGTHMLTHIEARFLLPSTFCLLIGAAYVAGRGWQR